MTLLEVLRESARLGVRLEAHDGHLRVEAPKGVVSPALKAMLAAHKPMLLDVLWRLEGMRRLATVAPRASVYARESARGGPGHCFSCGDSLSHPDAYGRCTSCDVAADAYYASRDDDGGEVAL